MKENIRKMALLAALAFVLLSALLALVAAATGWLWLVFVPLGLLLAAVAWAIVDVAVWGWQTLWGLVKARFVGLYAHIFVHRPKEPKSFASIEEELREFDKK